MKMWFETPEWEMLCKVMCMCWKLFYGNKPMSWKTIEAHEWEVNEAQVIEYINRYTVRGQDVRRYPMPRA